MLEPDEVVKGGLTVSASSHPDVLPAGTSSATGWADPVIELADASIPGSSAKHSDRQEIEFAPGYWALDGPTPVKPTTGGEIKGLYRRWGGRPTTPEGRRGVVPAWCPESGQPIPDPDDVRLTACA